MEVEMKQELPCRSRRGPRSLAALCAVAMGAACSAGVTPGDGGDVVPATDVVRASDVPASGDGGSCALTLTLSYGPEGGLVAATGTSTLTPARTYSHHREFSGRPAL